MIHLPGGCPHQLIVGFLIHECKGVTENSDNPDAKNRQDPLSSEIAPKGRAPIFSTFYSLGFVDLTLLSDGEFHANGFAYEATRGAKHPER